MCPDSPAGAPDGQNVRLTPEQQTADPLATPEFFPMRIDEQRNTMFFVQMSKVSFRNSVFLDKRAVLAGRRTLLAEIPKLRSRRPQCPLHVILHGAFCGSTLLARYFEQLPHCLVLKEPSIIGRLATTKTGGPAALWDEWLDVSMAMLARRFPGDVAVVIKAPDMSNWMGDAFLDRAPKTRVIFLHSSLKRFLLQTLKDKDRRKWLREHTVHLKAGFARVPFLSDGAPLDWTDGQCAAAMWLLNSFLCSTLLARPDHDRVLVLDGDALISAARAKFFEAASFLQLLDDEKNRSAVEHFSPITTHAKDMNLAYESSMRAADIAHAEAVYGDEVREAMSWAQSVSSGWLWRSPFPVE
jgi:hypothetical protein